MLAILATTLFVPRLRPLGQAPQAVTYEANALTVKQVLAELSTLTGTNLHGHDEILNERLVLHLEGVPLPEAMEKIAYVTFGKWSKDKDGYELTRNNADVHQNEKENFVRDIKNITAMLDERRQKAIKAGPFTQETAHAAARSLRAFYDNHPNQDQQYSGEGYQKHEALRSQTPFALAIDRVIATLPPETLAAMPSEAKIVFSNNPTQMEYALTEDGINAVSELLAEQVLWRSEAQKVLAKPAEGPGYYQDALSNFANAKKILVSITRATHSFGFQANFKLADGTGEILDQQFTQIIPAKQMEQMQQLWSSTQAAENNSDLPLLPLSATAAQFARILSNQLQKRTTDVAKTDPVIAKLMQPTRFDLFSLGLGEGILAMARSHHENLAMLEDDIELLFTGVFITEGKFNQGMYRQANPLLPEKIDRTGNWFTSRPINFDDHHFEVIDRASLEALLTDAYHNGTVSLDLLAEFALKNPSQLSQSLVSALFRAVTGSESNFIGNNNWDALRFYGSLSEAERALRSPQSVDKLSAEQQDVLAKMVYGLQSNLTTAGSGRQLRPADDEFFPNNFYGTIYQEPTEALPTGVPGGSVFTVMDQTASAVTVERVSQSGYTSEMTMEPKNLAWQLFVTKNAPRQDRLVSFAPATQRTVSLVFNFTKTISQNAQFTLSHRVADKVSDYHQLPADIVALIDNELAAYAKQNITFAPVGGTSGPAKP